MKTRLTLQQAIRWRSEMTKVLKEANEHGRSKPEVLELTDELLARIARFNGNLHVHQVKKALLHGETVYTSFCKYRTVSPEDRAELARQALEDARTRFSK